MAVSLAIIPFSIFGVYAKGEDIYYMAVEDDPAKTECLFKYTGGEPERLKILGYDGDSWVGFPYMRQWRNELLLPGTLGRSFLYDMDTGETCKIRTADLINSDFALEKPGMVCGNYLYYNYTPLEDGYVRLNALAPVRYNLMTGEEEAFTP